MVSLCYVNGKIQSLKDGVINISDLALQRGYGVFDFARTYNGKLFHFDDHIQRLRASASELHLKLPISGSEITRIAEQLLKDSTLNTPSVRLILTGGYTYSSPVLEYPNFIIIAEELPTYPNAVYSNGAKLIMVEYQRELAHVKSINYLNAVRLEPVKLQKNAFDILYHSHNGITECPRNNFFIFRGDTLVTPVTHVLHGITRKIILSLASNHFTVEEGAIHLSELDLIDEAIITSTSKRVIPVTTIDDQKVGSGLIGDRTKTIMRLFDEYTNDY